MTYIHPDDMPSFDSHLWDADPDVCCAAFQLGACSHTEDYDQTDDEDVDVVPLSIDDAPAVDDEPF